jgi:hypothetical protein
VIEAGLLVLGGVAVALFFISIYVDERWQPDVGRMSPIGRGLYRGWRRGLKLISLVVGFFIAGGIVVSVGWVIYDGWLPHDVEHEIVALQDIQSNGVFVALDKKCASEYQDSLDAAGLEAKERLSRIRRSCGSIIENGESAMLLRKDRALYNVRILSGIRSGFVGWTQARTILRNAYTPK